MGNIEVVGKITLADLRRINGMTQEKFSKYVGIPYTTYRRYEKNIESAGFADIVRICEKTGIDIGKIKI